MAETQVGASPEPTVEVNGAPEVVDKSEEVAAPAQAPETEASVALFQAQQERMKALHENCAEGDVMGVRAILSSSLELLESIDPTTGLTPMLQAIYANQVEVVKELMMAGAYPPPPAVTSDPAILAILYPAQMPPAPFGLPPTPAHFASMPPAAEFGYYGQPGSAQAANIELPSFGNGQHRSSVSQERHNDATKLPPTEVAKTIPCRNFPNCRYGDACVFQHPQPQHFFAPGPFQAPEFVPGGYPGVPMYYGVPPPAPFVPLDAQSPAFAPPMPPAQLRPTGEANSTTPAAQSHTAPAVAAGEAQSPSVHTPSQQAPAFQPRGANGFAVNGMGYPQTNGFDHNKKGHHVKRMSFGGMPKAAWAVPGTGPTATAARQAALGSWSNGQPPACVFFQNSKCRNGEMCKFPHIMPDGTDCRHPDVIAGTVAAAPVSTNPNFRPPARGRMSVGNNFHFERQQHFMKVQAMRQQQAIARGTSQPASGTESPVEKIETQTEPEAAAVAEETPRQGEVAQDQAQPVPAAKAQGPTNSASRTRSVPNTRAHSPTSSPAAAPRAPRTGGRAQHASNGQTARSTSIPAANKEVKQKLPSADDFPALAGSVGSLNGDSTVMAKPGSYGGKTAAQVLSAPAPPKPLAVEVEDEKTASRSRRTSSVGQGLSTESDDEAVVISIKEGSEGTNSESAAAMPASIAPKAPISFASMASKTSAAESPAMVASLA